MKTDKVIKHLRIDEGNMSLLFEYREISYISNDKNFIRCNFTSGKEIKIQTPFYSLINIFPKERFVLINNEIIINLNEIKTIIKNDKNSKIIMKNLKILYIDMETKNLLSCFKVI